MSAALVVPSPLSVVRTPQEWGALVRADLARSVEGFVTAGRHLTEAKAALPSGEWLPWIERELPVRKSMVEMLMSVARHPVLGDSQRVGNLPGSVGGLYELSRMEPLQLEAAIADGRVTPEMERKQARALVAEYRCHTPRRTAQGAAEDEPIVIDAPPEPGKVTTIVADPPWRYGNTSTRGAAEDHYPTMSIEELCALDVANTRSADAAHLYLWTTSSHLPDAFKVMEAWGFTYKTYLVWVKPQIGMGNYFRVSTELVLFGIKGGLITEAPARSIKNWFEAKRTRHSAKPELFHDLVMQASPGPYLELFSRCFKDDQLDGMCRCSSCRLGWEVWGNQA